MRTSDAALKLDFTEPSITAAKAVAETIAKNGSLQRDMLCGSWSKPMALRLQMVAGRWSLRDMLELAEVMYFAKQAFPPILALVSLRLPNWSPICRPTLFAAKSRSSSSNSRHRRRSGTSPRSLRASRPRTWCSSHLPALVSSLSSPPAPMLA